MKKSKAWTALSLFVFLPLAACATADGANTDASLSQNNAAGSQTGSSEEQGDRGKDASKKGCHSKNKGNQNNQGAQKPQAPSTLPPCSEGETSQRPNSRQHPPRPEGCQHPEGAQPPPPQRPEGCQHPEGTQPPPPPRPEGCQPPEGTQPPQK